MFFICLVPPLSRPLAIEPPALELQRGELAVVVGERGVEVRIVHRRTVVDGHEVTKSTKLAEAREATCKSRSLPGRWSEPGITRCAQARAERRVRLYSKSVRSGKSET